MKKQTKPKQEYCAEELMEHIRCVFGAVPFSVRVYITQQPTRMCVEVSYLDFMSTSTLHPVLNRFVPNGVKFILKRDFSDKAVSRFLLRHYKENDIAVVDCCNGSFDVEPIRAFVRARMELAEFP